MKNTPFRYLKRHSKKFKMSLNSLGGGDPTHLKELSLPPITVFLQRTSIIKTKL